MDIHICYVVQFSEIEKNLKVFHGRTYIVHFNLSERGILINTLLY